MSEYEAIAISWGWFKLKRGWYHANAQAYDQIPFLFPLRYRTAKELCEAENLTEEL